MDDPKYACCRTGTGSMGMLIDDDELIWLGIQHIISPEILVLFCPIGGEPDAEDVRYNGPDMQRACTCLQKTIINCQAVG
jgi:hypothetical protein